MISIIIYNNTNKVIPNYKVENHYGVDYEYICPQANTEIDAYNKGLTRANGDYILFKLSNICVDDDFFKVLGTETNNLDMEMITFDYYKINESNIKEKISVNTYFSDSRTIINQIIVGRYCSLLYNKLFNNHIIRKNHFFFKEEYSEFSFLHYVLQYMNVINSVQYIPKGLITLSNSIKSPTEYWCKEKLYDIKYLLFLEKMLNGSILVDYFVNEWIKYYKLHSIQQGNLRSRYFNLVFQNNLKQIWNLPICKKEKIRYVLAYFLNKLGLFKKSAYNK